MFTYALGKDNGVHPSERRHHRTLQRGKAHGGIYTATTANGGQRTTIAYMARNQPQGCQVSSQDLGSAPGTVSMADAVKTVTTDALLKPFIGAWVHCRSHR